jgi:hypothetical protein
MGGYFFERIVADRFAFAISAPISLSMKLTLISALAALAMVSSPAFAQDGTVLEAWEADHMQIFEASEITLDDFTWHARALVVFGEAPDDPQFLSQMDLLTDRPDDLALRDVIIITDTDPDNPSALRTELRPRGFMLALLSKDGRVALRKPAPWSALELSRSIDKMPLRQQEISDRRLGG